MGNLHYAQHWFEQYWEIFKALSMAHPDNADYKHGLAISYEKLGETHSALGNLEPALRFFEDQTQLFKELYEAYPTDVGFKNGLTISYALLGAFYRDHRHYKAQARAYFEQCHPL